MAKQLTTVDLRRILKNYSGFLGVYPINRVKYVNPPKHIEVSFIANLQADNLPGNHWVAVRRRSDNVAEYFDSYGRIPPLEIQHWLTRHSSRWTWNKRQVQNINDKTACGYLCVKFVKKLL